MASGIPVSDDCVEQFRNLKHRKHKYIIFSLSPDMRSVVTLKTSSDASYKNFLAELPDNECRWAVYDFEFEKDSAKRNKICFFSWSPDTAKIKQKMVFASSRDSLRRCFDGIHMEVQGTDPTEVEYDAILAKALSSTR
ncbi:hypothetical protein F5J12DRAFT_813337 [Pisolithus orientalis]|uniref:uncharacterized protein n=1 Tax=Pisolithus orientalis TaxID=936130 RepID=UPI0022244021|nr:uncharacterized protein F5J12DRAFT_813337 [Pisolithus orientalis]KAI6019805.1 hypothetical protein F5J12DRAFT_813337 [Pisolithus orientalis]